MVIIFGSVIPVAGKTLKHHYLVGCCGKNNDEDFVQLRWSNPQKLALFDKFQSTIFRTHEKSSLVFDKELSM